MPTTTLIAIIMINRRMRPDPGIICATDLMRQKMRERCSCAICVQEQKKRLVVRSPDFMDFI